MQNRIAAAAAAALAVTVLAGCDSRAPSQVSGTASVTVAGNDETIHIVKCSQLEWYRTINIGSDFAGAKIVIDQRVEPLTAESVRIQNLGGFTGMYSQGDGDDGGDAKANLRGDKFTVIGTAHGYETDKPDEPATVTFKIVVTC